MKRNRNREPREEKDGCGENRRRKEASQRYMKGFQRFTSDGADSDVAAAHHAVPAASAAVLLGNAADSVVVGGALRGTPRVHVNKHTH